ncbi:MAG TPA: N-acyl homoserine lactonase family protein [Armatimonadota bacterium]|jgi:glyoxylase-like metal-dependent hydrolase (beta-lactamase superfamily II)
MTQPSYRLRALKCGECQVRDYITYADGGEETSTFYLYVWLIEGGERPMLVDTGPKDLGSFNAGTSQYIPGGVIQRPEEVTPELLRRAGVAPEEVSHVFATHLHADHYEYFDLFPNARLVANRQGFLEGLLGVRPSVMAALARRWPESLLLVEDEEVLPGIRTLRLGCHSTCSQAIVVDTARGRAVLAGDGAYTYRNLEEDRPIGWADPLESRAALVKLRSAGDFVLPGHDPEILRRYPSGVAGA